MNPAIKPEAMIIVDKRTGKEVKPASADFLEKAIAIIVGYGEACDPKLSLPMPMENYKIRMWTGEFDECNMPIYEQIGD